MSSALTSRQWLLIFLLTVASIPIVGYQYGVSDNAFYLTLIRHQADPTFLANDWYVSHTWRALPQFIWLMAALSKWFSLPTLFFVLHVAERFLTLWILFRLAVLVFRDTLSASLSVIALLMMSQKYGWPLGGNDLFYTSTTPHTLGLMTALLAFHADLEDRPLLAAFLAGITTELHLLIGMHVMILIFASRFFMSEKKPWKTLTLSAVMYLAAAAPQIVPMAIQQIDSGRTSPLSGAEYVSILGRFRTPHHYIPSAWPPLLYASFASYVGLCALGLKYPPELRLHRKIMAYLGIILAMTVVGTLFVDVIPVPTVMKFQFFRAMIFLKLFAVLYLANFIRRELWSDSKLAQILAIGLMCTFRAPQFFGILGGIFTFVDAYKRKKPAQWALGTFLLLTAFVYTFLKSGAEAALLEDTARNAVALSLAIAAAGWAWFAFRRVMKDSPSRITAPAFAFLGSLLLIPLTATMGYLSPGKIFSRDLGSIVSGRIALDLSTDTEWDQVCEWIRTETPQEATFVIPPDIEDFRLRAERALFVDFKSSPFNEPDTLEWWRRMQRLIREESPPTVRGDMTLYLRGRYETLKEEDFRDILKTYGAEYVLVPNSMTLGFPVVHASGHWTIYRIGA